MKKQTIVFLSLLLSAVLIAVFMPGLLLKTEESQRLEQLNYISGTHYSFSSEEMGLSLFSRLDAAVGNSSSTVPLDFDAVSDLYGNRKSVMAQFNEELEQFCQTIMPSMPTELQPSLPDDAFLHYEYILDNATMQGLMFCVAECTLSQGEMYLIMDMESRRIIQIELYNTPSLPKLYDYFSLRISDNLASYLGASLVQSEFDVDTLNMLLAGGGEAGKMIFKDDSQEITFSYSCWQDGLIFYPGTNLKR